MGSAVSPMDFLPWGPSLEALELRPCSPDCSPWFLLPWWPQGSSPSFGGSEKKKAPPKTLLDAKSQSSWTLILGHVTFHCCVMDQQVHTTHFWTRPCFKEKLLYICLRCRLKERLIFKERYFSLGRMADRYIEVIQTGVWQVFFQKAMKRVPCFKKLTDFFFFLLNVKNQVSKLKLAFWKPCVCQNKSWETCMSLTASQHREEFLMRSEVLTNVIYLASYHGINQYLEELHNSVK